MLSAFSMVLFRERTRRSLLIHSLSLIAFPYRTHALFSSLTLALVLGSLLCTVFALLIMASHMHAQPHSLLFVKVDYGTHRSSSPSLESPVLVCVSTAFGTRSPTCTLVEVDHRPLSSSLTMPLPLRPCFPADASRQHLHACSLSRTRALRPVLASISPQARTGMLFFVSLYPFTQSSSLLHRHCCATCMCPQRHVKLAVHLHAHFVLICCLSNNNVCLLL